MGKRKSVALLDSDDSRSGSGSGSDSGSDIDKEMLSLTKKKGSKPAVEKIKKETFSSSSGSESDSDWGSDSKKGKASSKKKPAKRARRSTSGTTLSSHSEDDDGGDRKSSISGEPGSGAENSPSRSRVTPPTSSSVVSSSVEDVKPKVEASSDLEEGEVSDDEAEEFYDGYDENMMGDAEDQRTLNAMTEKEREQEIFRRIEKRDVLRNRFEAEKKLRMKKKLEAKLAKKGKKLEDFMMPEDSESDPFQMDVKVRSQERKKTVEGKVDKKTQAMDALKASRDAKIQRLQEKEKYRQEQESKRKDDADDDDLDFKKESDSASSAGDKRSKKLKASDVYSDDSASDDDEDRRSKSKDKSSDSDSRSSESEDEDRKKKPQFIETVEQLNKLRISRFKLERWLYLPVFEKTVTGCYVRVAITSVGGLHRDKGFKIYNIQGVQDGHKTYEFGNVKTSRVLLARLPGDDRSSSGRKFQMQYVSNQQFTEEEFLQWKRKMEEAQESLPTLHDIAEKEKQIKGAIEYQLQEEDIEAIITEKAKYKTAPVNFAARKAQLMKEKEIALNNNDEERAIDLGKQIQGLDERATELDKVRTSTISSISYINERNRKRNVEEAEKAILEELKANKGRKVEDPFTRRTTKPKIVSKANLTQIQLANGLAAAMIKTENGEDVKPIIEHNIMGGLTLDEPDSSSIFKYGDVVDTEEKRGIGDLFSAHDFDIKLELDANLPPNLPIVARPSATPMKETAPRRSLNLEEYKRKKGLI